VDLLSRLLTFDPSKRLPAAKALDHPYFSEAPLPASMMPTYPSFHDQAPQDENGGTKLKVAKKALNDQQFGQAFDPKRRRLG
jgi:serine/threonine protein kinase